METHYSECSCTDAEHTIRWQRCKKEFLEDDEEPEVYCSVYLRKYKNFFQRVRYGIKYMFGYQSKYGAFDCTLLDKEEAQKLIDFLTKSIN